jgi:hypothetical protein
MSSYRIYDGSGAFTGKTLTGTVMYDDIAVGELYIEADLSIQYPRLDMFDPQNIFEVAMTAIPYVIDTATITANGSDVATITGLPTGTVLTCDGETDNEVAGSILFGTDLAGTYSLVLSHPLYLSVSLEVIAS